MDSLTIHINGVDQSALVSELSYGERVNDVGQASFTLDDPAGLVVPADGQTVEIFRGGTLDWEGRITEANVEFLGWSVGTHATVTADDANALTNDADPIELETIPLWRNDWSAATAYAVLDAVQVGNQAYVCILAHTNQQPPNATYWEPMVALDPNLPPTPTNFAGPYEKTVLQWLVSPAGPLYDQGVTLDPGQASGSRITQIASAWWTVKALLEAMSLQSSALWRCAVGSVLSLWSIGSRASGKTLSLANGNVISVSWVRQRYDYRNREVVVFGPTQVLDVLDAWKGDGSSRSFALHYRLSGTSWREVRINGNATNVGTYGSDDMPWTYDAATKSLRQRIDQAVLTAADTLEFSYASTFPNRVKTQDDDEIAARGLVVRSDANTDITDWVAAKTWGDDQIRKHIPRPQAISLSTSELGIRAGETVTVHLPEIDLDAACFVQAANTICQEALDDAGNPVGFITRELTVIAGTERVADSVDLWRQVIFGAGAAGGSSLAAGSGGVVVTSAGGTPLLMVPLASDPDRGVQGAANAWIAVNGLQARIDSSRVSGLTLQVRAHVRAAAAGVGVTVRLLNVTDATVAGAAEKVTSVNDTEVTFPVDVATGVKYYRLELSADTPNADVFGIAVLESL